jgi:phytoene dehydrogenase-like protein
MISTAIADSARSYGAEIRTEAGVSRIMVKGGRAKGVVLEDGTEITAKHVISGVDPHRTFLRLCDSGDLDPEFTASIKKFKLRGSSGKVNLALDRFPEFTCRPGTGAHVRGDVAIAPSVDYLERAFDDAKYGDFSRRPFLNVVIPSLLDPSVAPPGKHVMSIFVQYANYALEPFNSRDEQRDAFGDAVINTLSEFAPNLKDVILHKQVLTPWDLEQTMGLTEGNIFHGELTLDQLFFFRPVPGWADYRTPVKNYYQCGSGCHPGGGITAGPGRLAALEILKDGL